MSQYLFLDFDGVMHSTKDHSVFFSQVSLLSELIIKYPVNIIISSSWRFQFDLTQLKSYFPQNIQHQIIDRTGKAHIGQYSRYYEIKQYLEDKDKSMSDWRALDDTRLLFPPDCENLILCNPNYGLQQKQLDILEQWLIH